MPSYRFVLRAREDAAERAEEFGLFNDAGAIKYARRLSHNRIVEIWEQSRLVARIDPQDADAGPQLAPAPMEIAV